MREDCLWDGAGDPDPEVARLERLLSEFRSRRPAPELPAGYRAALPRWSAIAAAVAVATASAWLATRPAPLNTQVAALAVGQTVQTGAAAHATVNIDDIGIIEVEPDSVLRMLRAGVHQHRMALERGVIHALIWAPPRTFVVDTPSAVATDLGCRYTLQVRRDGSGLVTVEMGWVSFERNGRESLIPAGAACQTRPGIGPGTPYRLDASPAFRQALEHFDLTGNDAALNVVLDEAVRDDAFTLWHLLARARSEQALRVYETLARLAPPPAGATPQAVLNGDRGVLDQWWDQLGLGDSSWFRQHQGQWP